MTNPGIYCTSNIYPCQAIHLAVPYVHMKPKVIVILGPTAVGKSDIAVLVAKKIKKAAVISADSRQVYKELNIGSGKITKKEMQGVPHYGLDLISPRRKKMYSVSEYKEYTDAKITELHAKGIVPIICGGTGFYIDAVIDGIVLPDVPQNIELRKKLQKKTATALFLKLQKLDPVRAENIDRHNSVRLIRAIEIATALGSVPAATVTKPYDTLVVGIDADDAVLQKRILLRIHKRIKQGMFREAKNLRAQGMSFVRMREFGLEYGLLADYLQKKISKADFIDRLYIEIWQYVKRQRKWFNRRSDISWYTTKQTSHIVKSVKEFIS